MFKKFFILAVAAGLSLAVHAQGTVQKLSDKVTVTFPGKPDETKNPVGGNIYTYKKDSTNMFMAMSLDLSAAGLSPEIIESMGDAFWDQMTTGMTQQMQGAVITKFEKAQVKGKDGRYLEIDGTKSSAPNLKGNKAFCYLFFIGANLHQFAYYTSNKAGSIADAKDFFDSIVIEK